MTVVVRRVETTRLTVAVHEIDDRPVGRPVVLVHGNVSSSPFYYPLMNALAPSVRPIAVDLRGFGETATAPVDASRGLADYADDVWATVDALGLPDVDLVGWSMGGGVVMQMLLDRPGSVTSLTLINPVSPYGFGGSAGPSGALVSPASPGLGVGGGTANPAFVAALQAGDSTADSPASPRSVFRSFYVAPGWAGSNEDDYVASMLTTALGDDNYPGTFTTAADWPGLAAGSQGVLNTMSPEFCRLDGIVDLEPKPPIAWIRGELDQIVSDTSLFDLAQLGALGVVPGYPGLQVWPPQPMVGQTRAVLERYGPFTEHVVAGTAHSPHIEKIDEVAGIVQAFLDQVRPRL